VGDLSVNPEKPQFLELGEAQGIRRIAFRRRASAGASPGLVWLGGFKSDMESTKAGAIDDYARERGRAFLRFDYSGHGASSGRFEDGTISRWLEESVAAFRAAGSRCCSRANWSEPEKPLGWRAWSSSRRRSILLRH
jgi:pimeloyl-ACP methyl ester carboxylesterase